MFWKRNYAEATITGLLNVNGDFFMWVHEETGHRKTFSNKPLRFFLWLYRAFLILKFFY